MPDAVLGDLYPFEDKYVTLDDGRSMHYIEAGSPRLRRPTFLLLHGNPTWSFLYRSFIEPLSRIGRVVAVDHMGFGRSDHPSAADYYTLEQHIQNLEAFCAKLGLKRIVPVVHDWGGPIGAGYATRHPDNIRGLVVLNTWAFAGQPRLPTWFRLMMKPKIGDYLYGRRNRFVEKLLPSATHTHVPDAVMDAYRHPFPTRSSREGVVAFPRMIPTSPDHDDWETLAEVEDGLDALDVPAIILWARKDPVFNEEIANMWRDRLPAAEPPVFFDDASHFLQEDVPGPLVDHIRHWARGL